MLLLLGRRSSSSRGRARCAVVHVALRLGLGVLLLLVALLLGVGWLLAVAAVVDEDVDAAVLGVLREVLVVVVVGGFGVLGDDVPCVEEAGDLLRGGVLVAWLVWGGERGW
jgi:hypothetical protein